MTLIVDNLPGLVEVPVRCLKAGVKEAITVGDGSHMRLVLENSGEEPEDLHLAWFLEVQEEGQVLPGVVAEVEAGHNKLFPTREVRSWREGHPRRRGLDGEGLELAPARGPFLEILSEVHTIGQGIIGVAEVLSELVVLEVLGAGLLTSPRIERGWLPCDLAEHLDRDWPTGGRTFLRVLLPRLLVLAPHRGSPISVPEGSWDILLRLEEAIIERTTRKSLRGSQEESWRG
jgi:hypothetical protein